jgi:hypothetical protein
MASPVCCCFHGVLVRRDQVAAVVDVRAIQPTGSGVGEHEVFSDAGHLPYLSVLIFWLSRLMCSLRARTILA